MRLLNQYPLFIVVQALLLVWLYTAVHGFAAPMSPAGPPSWREAAGKLAAEGTPAAVLAGSHNLDNPNISAGVSLNTHSPAILASACPSTDLIIASLVGI